MKIFRRDFLRIGAIPILGLNIKDYFRIRPKNRKSVIFFFLDGGPSQIDTYDPKPDAPAEIRGIYKAIDTKVPGVQFSELMLKQAAVADKICLVRSYSHTNIDHTAAQLYIVSGHNTFDFPRYPSFGSVAAKLMDDSEKAPLPNLFLGSGAYYRMRHGVGNLGMLPVKFNPLFIENDPNKPDFKVQNFNLADGITLENLENRRNLFWNLDNYKKFGNQKRIDEFDNYQQQAIDLLTGSGISNAFNIDEETRKTCDDYGRTPFGQRALLARRLVEGGVPFVSVEYRPSHSKQGGFYGWDHHRDIFPQMNDIVPPYDQAIAALINDLVYRNMLNDVLVIAFGEFGRTPKINSNAGRDHWSKNSCVLMAGGGLPQGVVYQNKPVSPQDLLATIYNLLGFPLDTRIFDKTGRGHLITEGAPLRF